MYEIEKDDKYLHIMYLNAERKKKLWTKERKRKTKSLFVIPYTYMFIKKGGKTVHMQVGMNKIYIFVYISYVYV